MANAEHPAHEEDVIETAVGMLRKMLVEARRGRFFGEFGIKTTIRNGEIVTTHRMIDQQIKLSQ